MSPLQKPILLLALAACLTAVIVQPGNLGSIDTTRRLQTTHSLWTSAPPVKADDYPNFGIVGRNGRIFSWYGIGQSVLMLPSDILITTVIRLVPALHDHQGFREVFVSYTVSTFVCVLAILLCFRFLLLLGLPSAFDCRRANTVIGHEFSPLHAEHDGEQFHAAVDPGGFLFCSTNGQKQTRQGFSFSALWLWGRIS